MDRTAQHPVVVGVDGSDQSMLALRFGVHEAERAGCGLKLVHAISDSAPMAPLLMVAAGAMVEAGEQIAHEAAARVAGLTGGGVAVETVVQLGARVSVLDEASRGARMVVLGHRERSALGRIFTSSTTTGLAARAHCPVVCVPAAWSPDSDSGRVVVGVEGSRPATPVLEVAFASAAARKAQLTVLHAWKLPSPYDDVVGAHATDAEWREAATAAMEALMADCRAAHPEVDVELDLRHQHPAHALVGATEGADLLVLGRRGSGSPFGFYLGSIARTLIREARCPVVIIPHHGDTTAAAV